MADIRRWAQLHDKVREDEFYVHHISILPSVNIDIDYESCWFSVELSWLTFSGEIYVEWR